MCKTASDRKSRSFLLYPVTVQEEDETKPLTLKPSIQFMWKAAEKVISGTLFYFRSFKGICGEMQ